LPSARQRYRIVKTIEIIPVIPFKPEVTARSTRCSLNLNYAGETHEHLRVGLAGAVLLLGAQLPIGGLSDLVEAGHK